MVKNRDAKGRFLKGHQIDNFGKGQFKKGHGGYLKHPNSTSFVKGDERITGKNNPNWKGDNAGYCAVHDWLHLHYGKAMKCDHCGVGPKEKGQIKHNIHWANKRGNYIRDRKEWLNLCGSCHKKYDNKRKREGRYNRFSRDGGDTG